MYLRRAYSIISPIWRTQDQEKGDYGADYLSLSRPRSLSCGRQCYQPNRRNCGQPPVLPQCYPGEVQEAGRNFAGSAASCTSPVLPWGESVFPMNFSSIPAMKSWKKGAV